MNAHHDRILVKSSALTIQKHVLWALMLRDIRTRFFGNGLGYVIAVLWPTVHVACLLAIYTISGRVSPLGDSTLKFFCVALVPIISFLYMSRFIMFAASINRPLLNFPVVGIIDIIAARAVLEACASVMVAVLLAAGLVGLDISVWPSDPSQALFAFLSAVVLGLGVGSLNAVIFLVFPGWALVYAIISIICYTTSGVVFMPDAMPEEMLSIVKWNPVLHSVEWMKESYYLNYKSNVLTKWWPFAFGFSCMLMAMAANRIFHRFIHR